MTIPVIPAVPPFGGVTSNTLQNAATGTANGTDMPVSGYATAVLMVAGDGSYSGTVSFQGSPDGTNFTAIRGTKQSDGTIATSVTVSGSTITIWTFQTAGLYSIRASITGDNTNKVTVTGFASNEPNLAPLAATITSTVLGAGSNLVGGVNVVDYGGTNQAAVDSNHNLASSMRVGTTPVPAGHGVAATALRVELPTDGTGQVKVVDSAGTNQVGVDSSHCLITAGGGTATVAVTAQTAGAAAVKAAPGRICRIIVTSTATALLNFYDNTNAASGTIIGSIPASTAIGTMFNPELPAAVGIYAGGTTSTPSCTVGYA